MDNSAAANPRSARHADFEGFRFLEYGETKKKTLSPSCPQKDFISIDLTRSRVVGFRVIISDYQRGLRNIRSICPILDTPSCADTELLLTETRDMSADIKGGYDSQLVGLDSLSKYYFEADGQSFCGSRSIEVSPTPFFVSVPDPTDPTIVV